MGLRSTCLACWTLARSRPLHAKQPGQILGGILALESGRRPPLARPLAEADAKGNFSISLQKKPATSFLLELIDRLQDCGTVVAIDTRAYARWLDA